MRLLLGVSVALKMVFCIVAKSREVLRGCLTGSGQTSGWRGRTQLGRSPYEGMWKGRKLKVACNNKTGKRNENVLVGNTTASMEHLNIIRRSDNQLEKGSECVHSS